MPRTLTKRATRRTLARDLRWMRLAPGTYSRIGLPDRAFAPMPLTHVHAAIDAAQIYTREFVAERRDCDNFARALAAAVSEWAACRSDYEAQPAFGYMEGRCLMGGKWVGHAWNWVIIDGRTWCVEPQHDRTIWRPSRRSVRRVGRIEA